MYANLDAMRQKRTTASPVKTNWETEYLRVTAFPRMPERARECGSWNDVVGREPETRQERPHERAVVEAGEFEDGWLTLQISPTRIDWRYTARVREDVPPLRLPVVGPFRETRDSFIRLMKRWLKTTTPIDRLAFGAVLLMPVADRKTGYHTLSQFLPEVQIDPEGMRDFGYRVNRRRPSRSGIKELQINRLSNWSVLSIRDLQLQLEPGRSRILEGGEPLSACRLELDMNTVPKFPKGLAKKTLPTLLRELVDLAVEISETGDTR